MIFLSIVIISKLFGLVPFFGIPLTIATPFIAFLSILYIAYNYKFYSVIFNSILMKSWIFTFGLFPFAFVIIHMCLGNYDNSELFRENGLIITQLFILCSTTILIYKGGLKYLTVIGLFTFIIIAFTFYLDYSFPFIFRILKNYIYEGSSKLDISYFDDFQLQRAAGFYFNPNAAGFALLNSMGLLIPYFISKRSIFKFFLFTVVYILLIFLTGSRGTMLSIPIITFLVIIMIKQVLRKKEKFSFHLTNFSIVFVGVFIVLFFIGSYLTLYNQLKESKLSLLAKRIELFLPNSDVDVEKDVSISHRLNSQKRYLTEIIKSPILGYGSTHFNILREKNPDIIKSHNLYFEITYMYGVGYLLFYLFCLALTFYYGINSKDVVTRYTLTFLSTVVFIAGMSNSSILDYRFFSASLGCIIGLFYNQKHKNYLSLDAK